MVQLFPTHYPRHEGDLALDLRAVETVQDVGLQFLDGQFGDLAEGGRGLEVETVVPVGGFVEDLVLVQSELVGVFEVGWFEALGCCGSQEIELLALGEYSVERVYLN